MKRAELVHEKAREMIDKGKKPSATRLSRELGIHESDVHRCLNVLEGNDKVETYTREVFGTRHRMVGVRRQ